MRSGRGVFRLTARDFRRRDTEPAERHTQQSVFGLLNVSDGSIRRRDVRTLEGQALAVGVGPGLTIRHVDSLIGLNLVEDETTVHTEQTDFEANPQAYVSISSDGRRLATGNDNASVALWDMDTLVGGQGDLMGRPAYSPDGQLFLANDTHITDTLNVVNTGVMIDSLTASAQVLALGNADGTASLRDLRTLSLLMTLSDPVNGHTKGVNAVALSHDGLTLATGSADQTVKLWSTSTGVLQRTLSGAQGEILSVVFTSDDSRLLTADAHNDLRLWRANDGTLVSSVSVPASNGMPLTCTVLSPDDTTVYFGAATVGRYHLPDWSRLPDLLGHTGAISSLSLSADGTRLVSGSNNVGRVDNTARLHCVP